MSKLLLILAVLCIPLFAQERKVKWNTEAILDVAYKSINGRKLLLDIYMPENKKFKSAPVLYYVHGGGWAAGSKDKNGLPLMLPVFKQLSAEGFVCVSINYRLYSKTNGVVIKDCVTDAIDGLRFLKKNKEKYSIDTDKIIVWGDSAGGQLAQMLTYADFERFPGDESLKTFNIKPLAGMSWYGPSDFTDVNLFKGPDPSKSPNRFGPRITGKASSYADNKKAFEEVSPIFWLKKESPPMLLVHGDKDPTIPYPHALHLKKKANSIGADVTLVTVKNSAHNWKKAGENIKPRKSEIQKLTADFALEQFKKANK